MSVDLSKMNMRKEQVLNMKKGLGIEGQLAQVVFVADRSASMRGLYDGGMMQDTFERILPVGLGFDDNGAVDTYLFHNSAIPMPEPVTLSNISTYMEKHINSVGYGGTSYAPIIRQIVQDYTTKEETLTTTTESSTGGGFFGRLFGGSSSKTSSTSTKRVPIQGPLPLPVYVIFLTDGECDDQSQSRQAMTDAANYGIFFQFVGIGNASFQFLQSLDTMPGRKIDNANFFQVPDLKKTTDADLYKLLMQEFAGYIPQAKALRLF